MHLLWASRLVLLWLVGSTSALYLAVPQVQRHAEESAGQFCASEPPEYSAPDLPQVLPPNLGLTRTAEELQLERLGTTEYMQNLTHMRFCPSARDYLFLLQPLIVPKLKLAFCYIPKVACSQFKDLFNDLNNLSSPEGFGRTYADSMPRGLGFPLANVSRENGWKFAAFTRDPALRYLSAWGSTCVSTGTGPNGPRFEHAMECCGPTVADGTVDSDTIVGAFEARVASDLRDGVVARDQHWAAQVEILQHCNWDLFNPGKLDFHGHLHSDVNAQVKAMLRVVNHTDDSLVDRFFPPSGRISGHRSPLHHIEPEAFYRRRETLEAVKTIYEDDYRALENVGCSFTEPVLASLRERADSGTAGLESADVASLGSTAAAAPGLTEMR